MKPWLVLIFLLLPFSAAAQPANVTEEDALNAILHAEEDVKEMAEAGFGTAYVGDALNEAKRAFEGVNLTALLKEAEEINDTQKREYVTELLLTARRTIEGEKVEANYTLVVEKAREISVRKQKAYEISDSLRALELRIKDVDVKGLNTTKAKEFYVLAAAAFENENYDEAVELAFQGNKDLSNVEAEATLLRARYDAARGNIISYMEQNARKILLILGIFSLLGFVFYNRLTAAMTRRKLQDMELERGVLTELMKKAQIERFEKGSLPKRAYEVRMGKYRERMLEINRTIPVLRAKLKAE